MPIQLDHLIIAVNDLPTAMQDYRELGFTVNFGGEHAGGTTHNALICFEDSTYIELLAPTGKTSQAGAQDFSQWLENGEGLAGYALLCDDLDQVVTSMRERSINIGDPTPGSRARPDGVEIKWKSAFVGQSRSPFFIEDVTERELRVPNDAEVTTHPNAVTSIMCVGFCTHTADQWIKRYEDMLGMPASTMAEPGFVLAGSKVLKVECAESDEASELPTWILLNASKLTDYTRQATFDTSLTHGANISVTVPGQDQDA